MRKSLAALLGVVSAAAALALGLSFVHWPKATQKACIYTALQGRYCDEFPTGENLTVLGATWEALSSLVIVFGAVVSVGVNAVYIAPDTGRRVAFWAATASSVYFLALGVVSFQFHRTHCKAWWRTDINLVRAFLYVTSQTLLFAAVQPTQGFTFPAASIAFPIAFCPVGIGLLWNDTSSSVGIIAFGAILYANAIAISALCPGIKLQYLWLLGITILVGGLFIAAQTQPWTCPVHPVAIGHSVLALYPVLFSIAIAESSQKMVRFQKL